MILMSAYVSGCVSSGDFCDVSKAYRPSQKAAAAMDDQDKQFVLSHNTYGARACGWRP